MIKKIKEDKNIKNAKKELQKLMKSVKLLLNLHKANLILREENKTNSREISKGIMSNQIVSQ